MFANTTGFSQKEYYLEEIRELSEKEKKLIKEFEDNYGLDEKSLTIHQLDVLVFHNDSYNDSQKTILSQGINQHMSDRLFDGISNPDYSEMTMLALTNGYLYMPNKRTEDALLDLINSTTAEELNNTRWNFIDVTDENVINMCVPEVFKESSDMFILGYCEIHDIEWEIYDENEQYVIKSAICNEELTDEDVEFIADIPNIYNDFNEEYKEEYDKLILEDEFYDYPSKSDMHKQAELYANMEDGYPKTMTLEKTYYQKMQIVCEALQCSSEELGPTIKSDICCAAQMEVATQWSQSIDMYRSEMQSQEQHVVLSKNT